MDRTEKKEEKRRHNRGIDLKGQRFGKLTALAPTGERASDGSVRWLCRCDCGKTSVASSNKLRMGRTKSCGCNRMRGAVECRSFVAGTCVEILFSQKLRKNNSSGHTGVCFKRGKWVAYICFAGKNYGLGSFDRYEEAVCAREQAEERIHEFVRSCLETKGSGCIDNAIVPKHFASVTNEELNEILAEKKDKMREKK